MNTLGSVYIVASGLFGRSALPPSLAQRFAGPDPQLTIVPEAEEGADPPTSSAAASDPPASSAAASPARAADANRSEGKLGGHDPWHAPKVGRGR